jgi:hypothetical protein
MGLLVSVRDIDSVDGCYTCFEVKGLLDKPYEMITGILRDGKYIYGETGAAYHFMSLCLFDIFG